jgi:polyisoprenoid-binding protein YceI
MGLVALLAGMAGPAAGQDLNLAPPATTIAYTAYALGLWPVHAEFERFAGRVRLNASKPADCDIDVTIEMQSLRMDDPDRRRLVLGPTMLDAAHFPTMHFTGVCAPSGVVGRLTLRGVTKELQLSVRQSQHMLVCTGLIERSEFGVNGLPGVVGPRIRIRLSTPMPNGFVIASMANASAARAIAPVPAQQ